ncbi:MAG: HipA N-terminal domain-containing protein [Bacteroidales bacterium]|nr:HipA N-terminal domain-containing protein [Bacteroidales bacterium]
MKQADIYVNDSFCGILTEDEEGYHFRYDDFYLKRADAAPLSPTMPLTSIPYEKEMMFPVFDGLIPEGWRCLSLPAEKSRDLTVVPFCRRCRTVD